MLRAAAPLRASTFEGGTGSGDIVLGDTVVTPDLGKVKRAAVVRGRVVDGADVTVVGGDVGRVVGACVSLVLLMLVSKVLLSEAKLVVAYGVLAIGSPVLVMVVAMVVAMVVVLVLLLVAFKDANQAL